MKVEKRVNEILSCISAFTKESYTKSEYLPELLKLQNELCDLTFNAEHAENGNLRLWHVERHFHNLNDERGHIADKELEKFSLSNGQVINNIKALISGNKGEKEVFGALTHLNCQNRILHNVELEFDGKRTEIDAIVFTNYNIFIIEIKNSRKNIFIDENGEFYRVGESMSYDCNIANKMNEREDMLRKVLKGDETKQLKILKVVVFTNPHIGVENKNHNHGIKVCVGCSYLTTLIEKFNRNQLYTYEDICSMIEAVNEAKCSKPYQMSINMDEFKSEFANLMAALETTEETTNEEIKEEPKEIKEPVEKEDAAISEIKPNKFKQIVRTFRNDVVAVVAGVTLVAVIEYGINRFIKK